MRTVILNCGPPFTFYNDRGSYYWTTPEAGGKVDKKNPTQFDRALRQLGVEMILAYSPEAHGRSERAFATHQDRLPKELAIAGITDIAAANRYLVEVYRAQFSAEFAVPARQEGGAFVPWISGNLETSCASRSSSRLATTTASSSKASRYRSRRIDIAAIMSVPR